jgi:hypothetical protein
MKDLTRSSAKLAPRRKTTAVGGKAEGMRSIPVPPGAVDTVFAVYPSIVSGPDK